MRHHLTPIRMAITKRQEIASVDKDVEKRELWGTNGENVNVYSYYGVSSKIEKHTSVWLKNSTSG